ncbi:multidrug resistance efflux transporter family protein [Bacillus sp. JJ634]
MRPIILGICAAFFFSVTFILNRAMELSGGSWIWSASLRYFFMVPFLLTIVIARKNIRPLFQNMKEHWGQWILWSSIGFGLFYAPICFAAAFAPGWLTASTWQITIISGSLLAPLFFLTITTPNGPKKIRGKIPVRGLLISLIILLGIALMQIEHASSISLKHVLLGIIPIIIASFAYPLGNRKMMDLCVGRLDAYQRVLGMTLASLPFWFILSLYGLFTVGVPSIEQTTQSLLVAISSGVLATVLFFQATDLVRGNMQKLAAVEATQSLEVLFTVVGEVLLLSTAFPSLLSWTGMFIIVMGMILHSYVSHYKTTKLTNNQFAKS